MKGLTVNKGKHCLKIKEVAAEEVELTMPAADFKGKTPMFVINITNGSTGTSRTGRLDPNQVNKLIEFAQLYLRRVNEEGVE